MLPGCTCWLALLLAGRMPGGLDAHPLDWQLEFHWRLSRADVADGEEADVQRKNEGMHKHKEVIKNIRKKLQLHSNSETENNHTKRQAQGAEEA